MKYTISDIVLLSWDSKQKSYNLSQMHKRTSTISHDRAVEPEIGYTMNNPNNFRETETHWVPPSKDVNNGVAIPKKFFNSKGEMDLRLAKGPEAVAYLRALGIDLPPIFKM